MRGSGKGYGQWASGFIIKNGAFPRHECRRWNWIAILVDPTGGAAGLEDVSSIAPRAVPLEDGVAVETSAGIWKKFAEPIAAMVELVRNKVRTWLEAPGIAVAEGGVNGDKSEKHYRKAGGVFQGGFHFDLSFETLRRRWGLGCGRAGALD